MKKFFTFIIFLILLSAFIMPVQATTKVVTTDLYVRQQSTIESNFINKTESIDNQIEKVDEEIQELNQQLKELNIHINTLNRVQKSDPEGIKNASLGMIIDFSKKGSNNNTKKKKHHH